MIMHGVAGISCDHAWPGRNKLWSWPDLVGISCGHAWPGRNKLWACMTWQK